MMRKILVLGHVDHGKTAFTCALNQVLYERFGVGKKESSKPATTEDGSITVNSSTVFRMGDAEYQYVDYPEFADYVDLFHEGKEKFDAAVMVCAATDGPLQETRKLAELARENGIDKLVVFLSKTDLVDDEEITELVMFEVVEMMEESGFIDKIPCVQGSSRRASMDPKEKSGDPFVDVIKAVDSLF